MGIDAIKFKIFVVYLEIIATAKISNFPLFLANKLNQFVSRHCVR